MPGIAISRDDTYQLSNRLAHAWWLASHGIPVVLLYLGFTGDDRIADVGKPFPDKKAWVEHFRSRAERVLPLEALDGPVDCGAASFRVIVRGLPVPADHS